MLVHYISSDAHKLTAKNAFKQQVHSFTVLACSPLAVAQSEASVLHGFMNDQNPSQSAFKAMIAPPPFYANVPYGKFNSTLSTLIWVFFPIVDTICDPIYHDMKFHCSLD